MPPARGPFVKPPEPSEGEEDIVVNPSFRAKTKREEQEEDEIRHEHTGKLTQSEFASWFGNALVLASLGTLSFFVGFDERTIAMDALSVTFVALAFCITLWASYKYFVLGRENNHWTEWILFLIVVAAVVTFVWFASFIL